MTQQDGGARHSAVQRKAVSKKDRRQFLGVFGPSLTGVVTGGVVGAIIGLLISLIPGVGFPWWAAVLIGFFAGVILGGVVAGRLAIEVDDDMDVGPPDEQEHRHVD